MKKRIITISLVIALLATCFAGTYAYLQDTDAAKNTMTVGKVTIEQIEQERGANGLESFKDNTYKLVPYTGSVGANGVANEYGASLTMDGVEYTMFDQSKNAIDKIVTVENTGTEEAYIRTLFAFEVPAGNEDFLFDRTLNITFTGALKATGKIIEVDGVKFYVCYCYYGNDSKLAPGATSAPSLRQLYLNANAGNDWFEAVGATYDILVLSQAVQTQGFADAETALNTAFGDPNTVEDSKLITWFSECK